MWRMKHIYARGNHRTDMFYEKQDLISAWNRFFLSAAATGTEIVSLVILNSHFHTGADPGARKVSGRFLEGVTSFMRSLRMSLSLYYNHKNGVNGSLGAKSYGNAEVRPIEYDGGEDQRDLICYHIRNPFHHGITEDFLNWEFSTAKFVFDMTDLSQCYTRETAPKSLLERVLPSPHDLPKGWLMMKDGRIVPPSEVFRADKVEALFGTKENYLRQLQNVTRRESEGGEESDRRCCAGSARVKDAALVNYLNDLGCLSIPQMTIDQRYQAVFILKKRYSNASSRQLARLFDIPASSILRKLKKMAQK